MKQKVYSSISTEQTQEIAKQLANNLQAGTLIYLVGDVGAGKTAFVRGLTQGLSNTPVLVQSPTYNIALSYPSNPTIHHIDLYRFIDKK